MVQVPLALFSLGTLALCFLAAPQDPPRATATIRGSFAMPEGHAAAGVVVELDGWPSNAEAIARHGSASNWKDLKVESDREGRFTIEFEPHGSLQYMLEAKLAGFAREAWRWSETAPGATIELGTIELRPGGSIAGRALDGQGRALTCPASVSTEVWSSARGGSFATTTYEHSKVANGSGAFRIDDLPAGKHRLELAIHGGPRVQGPEVEVVPGRTSTADVIYPGPALDSVLNVSFSTYPVFWAHPDPESIALIAPDGARLSPDLGELLNDVVFRGLGRGPYVLQVRDAAFERLELRDLEPRAQAVRATLVGRSALAVHVEDGENSRAPVLRFDAALRLEPGTFPVEHNPWQNRRLSAGVSGGHVTMFTLLEATDAPPADGILRGIPPGSYTLVVTGEGRAPEFVAVPDLRAGEVRELRVSLTNGGTIEGTVKGPGGRTIAAELRVFAEGEQDLPALGNYVVGREWTRFERAMQAGMGYERAKIETDAEGEFAIPRLAAGRYVVRARAKGKLLQGTSTAVTVATGSKVRVLIELTEMPDPFEGRDSK